MILLLEKSVLSIENIEKCKAEFFEGFWDIGKSKAFFKEWNFIIGFGFWTILNHL